jgi:drug/metabolite transporter (DMT)-like permease
MDGSIGQTEGLREPTTGGYPIPVLVVAVCAVSTAAILVRLMPDVPPIAAAFWRTAIVAVILAPWCLRWTRQPHAAGQTARQVLAPQFLLIVLAGSLLAVHFWTWFASLHRTTVLRSTVLVCLTPVWTGLLEWRVVGQAPQPRFWVGMSVAILGVALMSGAGGPDGAWLGDLLALVGGVLAGAYLLIGRVVRRKLDIAPYGTLLCAACALLLVPAAMTTNTPLTGFSTRSWLVLAAMALGPQLCGHIGFNYAVGFLPAAIVAATVLLEPVGAAALAAVLLDEIPAPADLVGAAGILLGVAIATLGGKKKSKPDAHSHDHDHDHEE